MKALLLLALVLIGPAGASAESATLGHAADIRLCQSTFGARSAKALECLARVAERKIVVFQQCNALVQHAISRKNHELLTDIGRCFHLNYATRGIDAMGECLKRLELSLRGMEGEA